MNMSVHVLVCMRVLVCICVTQCMYTLGKVGMHVGIGEYDYHRKIKMNWEFENGNLKTERTCQVNEIIEIIGTILSDV